MIKLRSLPMCVLASVFFCSISALAQQAASAVRIADPIDESQLVTLTHTVHPLANARNDRGAAPDGMQLDRLQLVLQRSPAQESALHQLIAGMHTPGSPQYHQWLTPAQFGAQFGASDQDIATIQTWLGSHGFNVTKVNPGKATLEFSGNVAQMREAFHTQIHKYAVNGETHYANANDPQIPAALAPVIGGFSSLNNFRIKSYVKNVGETTYDPSTGRAKSLWTTGSGAFDYQTYNFVISPADFAVQYDLNPVYAQGIKGDGQTIAIINESNINVGLVNQFRTLFGLPANPPQVIVDGNDPGVDGINNPDGPNYASSEAYLDVEWSGAVAPDATIDLVIGADTALESGLILAAEHAVYGNVAPVVSLSFGACEAELGTFNAFIDDLWEQAAAQGQTVMVSAGDNGAAGCDSGTDFAVNGQAVNGFGSTPYNVAVGGTDFQYSSYSGTDSAINTQLESYWTTTASNNTPAVSIKSYIPEQPWNDSQFGLNLFSYYADTGDADTTTVGSGGGASNCATGSGTTSNGGWSTCTAGYPKPSWQSGKGVPSDTVRDVPDVSLFSANGYNDSYYAICATDGDCQTGSSTVQIYGVGGTSASSPSFAGIMALVNQKYGRQGQADTVLYPLATQFQAAFHDVIVGNNSVPCAFSPLTPDCIQTAANIAAGIYYTDVDNTYGQAVEGQIGSGTTVEFNATAGYDLASGLGSVDAAVLLADWGNVKFNSASVSLTANPTTITHGQAVSISGTVTGSTPTGNVALMTDSTESAQQGNGSANLLGSSASTFALSSGSYSGSVTTLPGGTYNIWASYGGDTNNAGSVSQKTPVTVNPENSGIAFNLVGSGAVYNSNLTASVDYGTQLLLSAQVAPSADVTGVQSCLTTTAACPVYTEPTGTIVFKDNSAPINTAVINAEGDAEYNAPYAIGSHSVSASYSGDSSYNTSTATPITFTVAKDTPAILPTTTIETQQGQWISGTGQQSILTIEVENGAQYSSSSSSAIYPVPVTPPTGSVTLASTSLAALNGAFPLSAFVDPAAGASAGLATVVLPATTASGNYSYTIAYSGDSNYSAIPAASYSLPVQNINSDGENATTMTATLTGSISPTTTITVSGTVSGKSISQETGPTGLVYVYSSGNYPTAAYLNPGTGGSSSFTVALNSQSLFQGANYVTLQYQGDQYYNPSSFVLNSNAAISNPLADFSLVPVPPTVDFDTANDATASIQLSSVNGFTGPVALSCTAASGITCSVVPTSVNLVGGASAAATLDIAGSSATVGQTYNVQVTARDGTGNYIHSIGVSAVATSATLAGTFSLSSGGAITASAGATTGNTSTIYVTPANGFTGTVDLSCSVTASPMGAASPVTCGVQSSVSVTGASPATATLTANSTSTTSTGFYTVAVAATSGSITQTTTVFVGVPAFTLSASSPSEGISPGGSLTSAIAVIGNGGYSGNITFTCTLNSGAPTNQSGNAPTCSIAYPSGSSVTLSGPDSIGGAAAMITTTAASSSDLAVPKVHDGKGWLGAGGGAILALMVFFGIPARRRSWRSMLGILVALAALGVMSSCGGGGGGGGGCTTNCGGGNPGTTAGSYVFTVTGTGNPTVTPAPTTTFTFTVN